MSIYLKATGVLKLNSYWSRGFGTPFVQSQKGLQKLLIPVLRGFRKLLELKPFHRFLHKLSICIQKPLIWVLVAFGNFFVTALVTFRKISKIFGSFLSVLKYF
jgi:hypothetical protein